MQEEMQAAPIPIQGDPVQLPLVYSEEKEHVIDVQPTPAKSRPVSPAPSIAAVSAHPDLPVFPLADLSAVDRLFITKRLRVKNVLFLKGKKNKFFVRTPEQKILYTIEEENTWWVGYLFYGLRPLQLKVTNIDGEEIMRIDRPYACTARVLPCQLQRMNIFSPPDTMVGSVEQQWSLVKPLYLVKNSAGEHVFWIHGPYVTISCWSDVNFSITRPDGTLVGGTSKRWQGLTHALFLSPITDKFGVAFDLNLTVEEKALLLAATLLLDYMYYDA